jgi:hypothetical protein
MASGEIIDEGSGMNDGLVQAAIGGATLGAGAAIWLLVGYLIQRFAFRNPRPTAGTVLATSMSASMLLFSLVALLTFHMRYNYPARLMAWFKRFVDPIVLPDGRELLTLRDAAEYITALPKAEHDAADWQSRCKR